ncbi:MAG: response regulator transcription factor [Lachnospiraceae bacterium]|nr:response regulator transcription factor [Lachnospiraceae bacterium]
MKNVLILEDDGAMLEAIGKIISEIEISTFVYKINTLTDAYQIAIEHDISLFIIDIIIDRSVRNDVSGLVFVENIRKIEKYAFVPVIFMTALTDPELHAYRQLHCYGYLGKPLVVEEAKKLIEEALKYSIPKNENSMLYTRKDGIIYAVKKSEIVYIKSHGGKIVIKTLKDELTVYYRNCRDMLKELDSDKYIQCNRSTIVNRDYIQNVDLINRVVKMKDDFGIVQLGKVMKKSFMDKMGYD